MYEYIKKERQTERKSGREKKNERTFIHIYNTNSKKDSKYRNAMDSCSHRTALEIKLSLCPLK